VKYPDDFINKIICGDCLEVMKNIPDKSIDLVLTDPPYGKRKDIKWDNKDNFISKIDLWFNEFFRISKYGIIIFCADSMIHHLLKNREHFYQRLLIWNKPAGSQFRGACNNNLWFSIELILVFSQDYENLKKNYEKNIEYSYQFFNARTIPSKKYGHPIKKPIELMRWLILHFTKNNQIILDSFLGSGTTAVACKELGRNYIGIEISPEYCEIARRRVNAIPESLF